MLLCLPFYANLHIRHWFLQVYLNPNLPHPYQWANVDFKGIPKTRDTDRFAKLRWIAGVNAYRQWYNRIWGRHVIPREPPDVFQCVRSYGFKIGYTPDDVADLVVEAVS